MVQRGKKGLDTKERIKKNKGIFFWEEGGKQNKTRWSSIKVNKTTTLIA